MVPGISMMEILLVGAIALVVVGPKDLPLMMRKVGKFLGQAKRLAGEFQSTFDELGRQAELDELRKEVEALKRDATGDIDNELKRTGREIDDAMRDRPRPVSGPAGEASPRIAPPGAENLDAGKPAAAPPPPPKPAGPRIEPVAQPRPRPRPVAASAEAPPAPATTSD